MIRVIVELAGVRRDHLFVGASGFRFENAGRIEFRPALGEYDHLHLESGGRRAEVALERLVRVRKGEVVRFEPGDLKMTMGSGEGITFA